MAEGAKGLFLVRWGVRGGGGQAGTGVEGLMASLEDEGGVSVAAVYLTLSPFLTGVDGLLLLLA